MDMDSNESNDAADTGCIQIKQSRLLSTKMKVMRRDLKDNIHDTDIRYGKLFMKRIGADLRYKSTKDLPILFARSDKNKEFA
jgi:hypothetical protein